MPQCPVLCSRASLQAPLAARHLGDEVTRLRFLLDTEWYGGTERHGVRHTIEAPFLSVLRDAQCKGGRHCLLCPVDTATASGTSCKSRVARYPLPVTGQYTNVQPPASKSHWYCTPTEIQYDSSRFPGRSYSVSVDGEAGLARQNNMATWQRRSRDKCRRGSQFEPKHAPAQVSGLPARDRESCASVR
jgi:hypothetical protein